MHAVRARPDSGADGLRSPFPSHSSVTLGVAFENNTIYTANQYELYKIIYTGGTLVQQKTIQETASRDTEAKDRQRVSREIRREKKLA